jgi:hypothetical protein
MTKFIPTPEDDLSEEEIPRFNLTPEDGLSEKEIQMFIFNKLEDILIELKQIRMQQAVDSQSQHDFNMQQL